MAKQLKDWDVEYGGVINKYFTRNFFTSIDHDEDKMRNKFNNRDFYRTNYIYENKDDIDNSLIYGPFILDLDIDIEEDENLEKIKADLQVLLTSLKLKMDIGEENLIIYFSGNKGFHVIIPPKVMGVNPEKNLNIFYKSIAEKLNSYTVYKTIDMKIYDKRRLIRVPNSINNKTGLYKVPITFKQVTSFDLNDLKEYASCQREILEDKDFSTKKKVREFYYQIIEEKIKREDAKRKIRNKGIKIERKKMPDFPCIKDMIKNGAVRGQRNNSTVALSSVILQGGFNYEEAKEIITEWNSTRNEEPLSDREIETTFDSAYRMFKEGKKFGCNTLSEISTCNNKCKLYDIGEI